MSLFEKRNGRWYLTDMGAVWAIVFYAVFLMALWWVSHQAFFRN